MRIVGQLCKFFCDLVGWQLPGTPVLLRIDDTDHPQSFNTVVKGTIYNIVSGTMITGPGGSKWSDDPFAIIHVDSSLNFSGENIEWLLAIPRHSGYGIYQLWWAWIAIYILVLERPILPEELLWNDIRAICSMKTGE